MAIGIGDKKHTVVDHPNRLIPPFAVILKTILPLNVQGIVKHTSCVCNTHPVLSQILGGFVIVLLEFHIRPYGEHVPRIISYRNIASNCTYDVGKSRSGCLQDVLQMGFEMPFHISFATNGVVIENTSVTADIKRELPTSCCQKYGWFVERMGITQFVKHICILGSYLCNHDLQFQDPTRNVFEDNARFVNIIRVVPQ